MIDLTLDCIEAPKKNNEGYGFVCFRRKGKWVKCLQHRLVYCCAHSLQLDDIKGKLVRHLCHNKGCFQKAHLDIGTASDNARDCVLAKRTRCGEINNNAVLSAADVTEIRNSSEPQRTIAKKYGIAQSTVSQIKLRKTWKDLL